MLLVLVTYQKILKIKEHDDVEETVAANTLGTVVHNTLEDLYEPLVGTIITIEIINLCSGKSDYNMFHIISSDYMTALILKILIVNNYH